MAVDPGPQPDLLSASERAWLAAHPRIVLGIGDDWAPWVTPSVDGQVAGFAADHLRLLGEKLGIRIGLAAGPWHEVVRAAEAGRLDGLPLAAPLPERRAHFAFTKDFHTVHVFVYLRDGDPLPPPGLAGLAGRRVGYLNEVLRGRNLLAQVPGIQPLGGLSRGDRAAPVAALRVRAVGGLVPDPPAVRPGRVGPVAGGGGDPGAAPALRDDRALSDLSGGDLLGGRGRLARGHRGAARQGGRGGRR